MTGFSSVFPTIQRAIAMFAAVMDLYNTAASFYNSSVLSEYKITNLVRNLTFKIQAIGTIAFTIYEFKKYPIQAAAFFAAGAITLIDRKACVLPANVSWLWRKTAWVSRGNVFWNGNWVERGVVGFWSYKKLKKSLF